MLAKASKEACFFSLTLIVLQISNPSVKLTVFQSMAATTCPRCLNLEIELDNLQTKIDQLRAEYDLCGRSHLPTVKDQVVTNEEIIAHSSIYSPFSRLELKRYGRQMLVKEFGVKAQLKLRAAKILLIGVGGLGSPVALYLAAMGVGTLAVVDDDHVDQSNLHRQILYDNQDAKELKKKVESAKRRLQKVNPLVQCVAYAVRFTAYNALKLVGDYDVVVDASDNVRTRYLANDACARQHIPLVSGSALGLEGQVTVFTYKNDANATGCYRCLYPTPPQISMSCAENGVIGVVPGIIGCIQAMETVKILTGVGIPLDGVQCFYDAYNGLFRHLKIGKQRNPDCLSCGRSVTEGRKDEWVVPLSLPFENNCMNKSSRDADLDPKFQISVKEFAKIRKDAYGASDGGTKKVKSAEYALLDTRASVQFKMVHFPEAVNIPASQLINTDPIGIIASLHGVPLSAITKQSSNLMYRTFVICRRGVDSVKVTQWLVNHGILNVFNIEGGYTEYAKEGGVDPEFPMY
ncbi:adenylyltransferase and sulfurtransferase mocs3-like [Plasmopara halstedii]|uniref:Adenylyltransferase and sulfurtransferase mocs3-like n=1 Tax=Plasmopara halstedii TaxID=4781 RepID=A0A0P1AAU3_PLAHL|nr:adenylyltransferase and sulfurtransferase mocs3-like [Plasmopara halstedii]CEG37919.1 adenylyltransferase and sulfurtransferase mocs3-like [Plasmopara halstedii]|eukprot:XP_024574288.1 adenylyltransferase and sulfurtransferase mocs3-like [Plasmopara halstedii]